MREIMACSGGQFSPKVVQALVRLHRRKMLPRPHQCATEEKAVA
jgi:HD-GYP domain-containing protein (c-di-GMP phosphodiesterase class II)